MSHGELYFDDPVTGMPILFLWPHAGCNARCRMCDIWQDRSRREIDPADVRRWAAEWADLGVRFVIITGGEALMHSRLWEICAALRSHGISITLLSTGITLARRAADVVRWCNGGVTVSLDGPGQLHDEVRRVPKAHLMLERGIAALREIDPGYRIFSRCAVHRFNYLRIRETVRYAKQIGLDRISFLATDVASEAFNRADGWTPQRQEELLVPAGGVSDLEAEVEALIREHPGDFASGFINESPTQLRVRLVDFYRALHGLGDLPPVTCNAPWASALIEVDGTVRPCFFQPAYGNLHEAGSLQAVINSPHAIAFRSTLDMATNPICRRCVCTFEVKRCVCGSSRNGLHCDNTCMVLDLLAAVSAARDDAKTAG
jgi:MoaA/NifB/PqqE/SkfB family radical SAM enzyme